MAEKNLEKSIMILESEVDSELVELNNLVKIESDLKTPSVGPFLYKREKKVDKELRDIVYFLSKNYDAEVAVIKKQEDIPMGYKKVRNLTFDLYRQKDKIPETNNS